MKSTLATSLLVLCVVGGCSSGPERIDTKGNHPVVGKTEAMTPTAREAEVDTGLLQVSAQTGYTVYDTDGLKVAHGAPAGELKLAPGRYFVMLDEPVQGSWKFWVTVQKGKMTRVDTKGLDAAPVEVR